jgi:CRP-like cAMP-binding protein
MSPYFVHVGYVLTLSAFITRDVLWLRGLLVCAQTIVALYAWNIGVLNIAAWNSVFACINSGWVVRILRERRAVQLPEDLRVLYERHFAALTPPEFLRWWNQGERQKVLDRPLASRGVAPGALFFVLGGHVSVRRGAVEIADLPAGFFVAEMSVLTGELPTADAVAIGEVEVMRWPVAELQALRGRNPAMWNKIQSILGHDLVEKLKLSAARHAVVAP